MVQVKPNEVEETGVKSHGTCHSRRRQHIQMMSFYPAPSIERCAGCDRPLCTPLHMAIGNDVVQLNLKFSLYQRALQHLLTY